MKKIMLVLISSLFILIGCSKQEVEEELFIEFNYNGGDGTIEYITPEYDKKVDPLSSDIILDTNGVVTYTGQIDERLGGQQRIVYTVTSKKNPEISKEYTVIFIVDEPTTLFNSSGYPNFDLSFIIDYETLIGLETRLDFNKLSGDVTLDIQRAYFPDGYEGKGKGYIEIFQPGTDEVPWDNSKWCGNYELIEDRIYRVYDLHKETYCGEMCPVEVSDDHFEAYFYFSSLDENLKFYYSMEYPENGFESLTDYMTLDS